jgi:hypothetical protein
MGRTAGALAHLPVATSGAITPRRRASERAAGALGVHAARVKSGLRRSRSRLVAPRAVRPDGPHTRRHEFGRCSPTRCGRSPCSSGMPALTPRSRRGLFRQDAANLAWKLDLVLRGLASDELLTRSRSSDSRRWVIRFAVGKVLCEQARNRGPRALLHQTRRLRRSSSRRWRARFVRLGKGPRARRGAERRAWWRVGGRPLTSWAAAGL